MGKFLTPVLMKLASLQDGVRKKVMELLVHINKRVKSRSKVPLPVSDLLRQYSDPNVEPFVTNFTIIYIKMGFPRLSGELQAKFLPQLVACLVGRPEPQQNSLLQLIVGALIHVKIPSTDEEKNAFFLNELDQNAAKLLLSFMQDVILLPYNYSSAGKSESSQSASTGVSSSVGASATAGALSEGTGTQKTPPPGLSENGVKRVLGENPPGVDDLEKMKCAILSVISCGVFSEHQITGHLVMASADGRHSVSSLADLKLKQLMGGEDWNKPVLISQLFSLFLGTGAAKVQNVKPENKVVPASVQQRLKIFPCLMKSREAASQFPGCIQVVFDSLFTTNSNARLKMMAVQFVHHLCLSSSDSVFTASSSLLWSAMLRLIGEAKEDPKLRGLAYVALGKIGKRKPSLVTKDLSIVQNLFDSLSEENAEIRSAVQETLALLAGSLVDLDQVKMKQIEALIMQNVEKVEPQARLMAVRYASLVFPMDHFPSRYVLLLACGDSKEEIYTEASKALKSLLLKGNQGSLLDTGDPKRAKLLPIMPSFVEMIAYIHDKATERIKGPQRFVVANNTLAFNPAAYVEILLYLRMCMAHSAGVIPAIDSIVEMQEQAPAIAPYVRRLLAETGPEGKNPVSIYLDITRQLLNALHGPPAMYCLLEMVAMATEKLTPEFVKQSAWIKGFMFSSQEEMRKYAAELFALVTVHCNPPKHIAEVIQELTTGLRNQVLEVQHGSLICLGYLIGKVLSTQRKTIGHCPVAKEISGNEEITGKIAKAIPQIAEFLDSPHLVLSMGACFALGEIGRSGSLILPDGSEDGAGSGGNTVLSKLDLVKKFIGKVQSTKDNSKLREKATVCLGYLCVGEPEFVHRRLVIDGLLNSAAAKQFELHCTIGDALVCAALGSKSPSGRDLWTCPEDGYQSPYPGASDDVATVLNLLLENYLKSQNPHIRQAASIWLTSIVKKCGDCLVVQTQIMNIQSAFVSLLGENDELTQDIVSKGLGIVYEKCNAEQKQQLVGELVETLTTGKRKKLEVTGDTQVFQEGSLGKTPDGQSMSTYKELCSIANDLNQPDLIYKFMHLANHNATWNAKKGAAFGFSTIASQAGEQLAPHLDKIIPKLYRYQFDPNPRIQSAMTSIWNALVTDSQKMVSKYIKEILDDLLKNLVSNQWRIRESSCLAINDLLRGRSLDDIVGDLPALWQTCFKVRDDIKESVRNAADVALKTLSRVSVKLCDVTSGKSGEQATGVLLSCLLQHGLTSQVQEVRAISLATITKICSGAGVLVKPHIPLLAVALLESVTTLESQVFNYLSHFTASDSSGSETQEKLDNVRISAYKTSPMIQVVTGCVQYIDGPVLDELAPRLIELLRGGLGFGTKVCCANFVVSIVKQCPQDIVPFTGKFLAVMVNGLGDRNITVRKSYATAIGHLVKVSRDSSIEKLTEKLRNWYLEKDDDAVRESCGLTIQAMNRHSHDILKSYATAILPLVFLGMHDKKETEPGVAKAVDSCWEEVWLEVAPGTETAVRLYLTEIVDLARLALASQSWRMKAQAALTMRTVADKLGASLGPPHLGVLVSALLEGLVGRTWDGKDSLLKALATVCISCKELLSCSNDAQPSVSEIIAVCIKECRKENIKYKMEAIRCTSNILEAHSIDRFKEMSEILYSMLKPKEKDDESNGVVSQNLRLEVEECVFDCIVKCWPINEETQSNDQLELSLVLTRPLGNSTWKVELCAIRALVKFIGRLHAFQDLAAVNSNFAFITTFLEDLIPRLCTSLGNPKYSALRSEALATIEIIINRLKDCDRLDVVGAATLSQLQTSLGNMKENDTQAELQGRAQTILAVVCQKL